jgi:glycerol-3-phosphate acyltransferase PlsY
MDILIMVILGYVFGSIPWALIIGKVFYKTDIRQHGSGKFRRNQRRAAFWGKRPESPWL